MYIKIKEVYGSSALVICKDCGTNIFKVYDTGSYAGRKGLFVEFNTRKSMYIWKTEVGVNNAKLDNKQLNPDKWYRMFYESEYTLLPACETKLGSLVYG